MNPQPLTDHHTNRAPLTPRRLRLVALKSTRALTIVVLTTVFLLGSCLGCAPAQRWLDHKGLEDYASTLSRDLEGRELMPPRPLQDLSEDTSPTNVSWTVSGQPDFHPFEELIQETLQFPSAMSTHPEVGKATFWVYRHGPLGARPVILWLPGNGFAPIAYPFVKHFYSSIINAGYDLIVWVPPFHMNRTDGAKDASILGVDTAENVRILTESVREIRTLIAHLTARGVPHIGGWGGSMGAAIIWLVSAVERFDHLSLMIPVIDWRTLTLAPDEMAPLNARLAEKGISRAVLDDAYLSVSPIAYDSHTPADRIQILYAELDQLTPESVTLDFAQSKGIKTVHGYNRSHATMLVGVSLYVDYSNFLRSMKTSPPSNDR